MFTEDYFWFSFCIKLAVFLQKFELYYFNKVAENELWMANRVSIASQKKQNHKSRRRRQSVWVENYLNERKVKDGKRDLN